jgi:DNA-binding MarR family transcriptional regulator
MERKPNLQQQAYVKILVAREVLYAKIADLLKPYDLTEPQFNVLRILRGAGPGGLPCLEVGRRLITRVPDVTRLLDRLETTGLVTRHRSDRDRRVVNAHITARGLKLIGRLDRPIERLQQNQFAGLNRAELLGLMNLLDRAMK